MLQNDGKRRKGRAQSVKEWRKTNKALFSMRGAYVRQMEVFLLLLHSVDFGLGAHSVWVEACHVLWL